MELELDQPMPQWRTGYQVTTPLRTSNVERLYVIDWGRPADPIKFGGARAYGRPTTGLEAARALLVPHLTIYLYSNVMQIKGI